MMRRGPAGPRTLCNACGLTWANKVRATRSGKLSTYFYNPQLKFSGRTRFTQQNQESLTQT
ncbi:hypothetical protein SLEP1_g10980 [Rubroshorea leprosula]|nr:hypothetical protein SLEP1_g10980 [Rubroshorea leprosula]